MDCPHIPELGYGEFSKRLHDKVAGQRIPIVGSVELTFQCNLRCKHCYLDPIHDGIPGPQPLTVDEYRGIFSQLADAGTLWLLLTGGEPLLHRDFHDIYLAAKRAGFIITLFTNGTLFTPQLADLLAEWRPFQVEITLYGLTQATYESVTGIPGSHARCMRGIELLRERGVPFNLKTIAMTLNVHELEEMKAFAADLGVVFRFDPVINACLDGGMGCAQYRLSAEEVADLDVSDPRRMKEWLRFQETASSRKVKPEFLYQCGAGLHSYHIDPYGQLSICMLSRTSQVDLRQTSFLEGWETTLKQERWRTDVLNPTCTSCDLRLLCGQCPGVAQMEMNDPAAPVPYLCEIAHQRAQVLGLAVVS